MHSSARLFHHNLTPPKPLLPPSSSASLPYPKPNPLLRRDFLSSSLLLLGVAAADPLRAETVDNASPVTACPQPSPTKQAFLDISIDGEPIGRIVIGLYADAVPGGAARFAGIVSGSAGVSYRRKEFVKIMPNYVQHGGLRSYGVDVEMAKKTGWNVAAEDLMREWEEQSERCEGTKNVGRSVSLIVRDPSKPPPKMKLVARKGKLVIDEEEMGRDPNGTEFAIAVKDSPELDTAALVVGRVVDGMAVVERIGRVKTVQDNTTSPYFRYVKSYHFINYKNFLAPKKL